MWMLIRGSIALIMTKQSCTIVVLNGYIQVLMAMASVKAMPMGIPVEVLVPLLIYLRIASTIQCGCWRSGLSICASNAGYGGWRHRMTALPGDTIYFAYLPNGHISKDQQARSTTYGVYWSSDPAAQLASTTDLTVGNLVNGALQNFDDGNCGESFEDGNYLGGRAGDGKPCIGSFTIPTDASVGVHQFVWFWTFYDTDSANVIVDGYYGAAYTTCFDVKVLSGSSSALTTPAMVPASGNNDNNACFVGDGDKSAGIYAEIDSNCPNVVGCYGDRSCKFCRAGGPTAQNGHMDACT